MTTPSEGRRFGRDMTSGSIPRHLTAFAIPMIIGNAIQAAYSVVNAIWVGKGLGEASLAAVTESFPIIFVLMAVAIGLTTGTGIIISQFAGAKNWERVRHAIRTSTVAMLAVAALLVISGQALTPWIMHKIDSPPEVYVLAVSYMRVMLFMIPSMFGVFLVVSFLRGLGDSKTPLYFQAGSLAATAILDPILMFGWLGMPKLGLNGTAVATIAMQTTGLIACVIYLRYKDHIVTSSWRKLSVDLPMLWLIIKIGLPTVVQQSLVSIGTLFTVGFVNAYGKDATAAFGAGMRIDQIAFLPALTFNSAVATLVGQNIGAGQLHRVKEIFLWGAILAGGITLFVSLGAVCAPGLLVRMFLDKPAAVQIAVHYLQAVGACYVFFAIHLVCTGVINGSGHTFKTTIISLVGLWCGRVPLAYYLSHRLHRVEGIWYAVAVSAVFGMILSLGYYASGRWKKPVVAKHFAAEDEAVAVS